MRNTQGGHMVSGLILAMALQAEEAPPSIAASPEPSIEVNEPTGPEVEPEIAAMQVLASATIAEPVPDIPRDTPLRLMVLNEVSTKDHEPGHRFKLRVDAPVLVDGKEVVPVGATAWGELLTAEKSGNIGKSGKLSARLLYLDLDGREIPIDGATEADGKSGKGETILGVLSLGVFGLFAKGNNAKLKAGEKMTAFISDDVIFDDAADATY